MDKNLISFIMPVYNAENVCENAIDSFLKFNLLARNSFLYIIDDCSTDKTSSVIQGYANHPKIKILTNSCNLGPGLSRMLGLEYVTLGHVGFIDADDQIEPENFGRAFESHLGNAAEITCFNASIIKGSKRLFRYDLHRITNDKIKLKRLCARHELDGSVIFSIYDNRMLKNKAISFGRFFYEDLIFHYKSLLSAQSIQILKYNCYTKNNIVGSIVNSISARHIEGIFEFIYLFFNLIKNNLHLQFSGWQAELCYGYRLLLANLALKLSDKNNANSDIKDTIRLFVKQTRDLARVLPLFHNLQTEKDMFLSQYYNSSISSVCL